MPARRILDRIEKMAASKKSAKYQQSRRDRRPIRVENLVKKARPQYLSKKQLRDWAKQIREGKGVMPKEASPAGQDLRLPIMGGTKFPTKDSLAGAKSLLTKSIGKFEVGPTPSLSSLSPSAPTIPEVAAVPQGAQNLMPKVGSDMHIETEPLVQHLNKQAEDLPKKGTPAKRGRIPSNITD